jgi:hypothetical protein
MTYGKIARSLFVGLSLFVNQALASESWHCNAQPSEPCFKHHGRLSSQNGIAQMIWVVGTKRILRVQDTDLPSVLNQYLELTSPNHSYIYGDFTLCPLAPDKPGHMRPVCVNGAEKLVVQNDADPKRVFRLLSTWPARGR